MRVEIYNRLFEIDNIKSIYAKDPDLIFIISKDGSERCVVIPEKENLLASQYLDKIAGSLDMLTIKTNNEKKYPIHTIILSPLEEIRYWYDDCGDMHIAVWNNGNCIVTDTEEIADTFRNIVKYILKR